MDRKTVLKRELAGFTKAVRSRYSGARFLVFGSRAGEDYLHSSDYDILVISPGFGKTSFLKRASVLLGYWERPESADLFGFTPKELESRRNEHGIVGTALRTGVFL